MPSIRFRQEHPLPGMAWLLLGAACLMAGLVSAGLSSFIGQDQWTAHETVCVGITALIASVLLTYRGSPPVIFLQDHRIVFSLAFVIYFMVGAAAISMGGEESTTRIMSDYPIDASKALLVDAVNLIGYGLCLIASSLARPSLLPSLTIYLAEKATNIKPLLILLSMAVLGVVAKIYTVGVDFGILSTDPQSISGLWRTASRLHLIPIFFVISDKRFRGWMFFTAVAGAALFALLGLLELSKSDALLPLFILMAGLASRHRSALLLVLCFVTMYLGGNFLGAPINFARINLADSSGSPLQARLDLVSTGLTIATELDTEQAYSIMQRLSYAVSQGAAIDFYDAGDGGDDLPKMLWVFVPRALAANKPNMTSTGEDFYFKITGRTGSSTGQGIFANAYYNAGWPGLVILSILCGWILAQSSAVARRATAPGCLALYPLAFMGVFIGFRIDGTVLADYLGAFTIMAYSVIGLTALTLLASRIRIRRRRLPPSAITPSSQITESSAGSRA